MLRNLRRFVKAVATEFAGEDSLISSWLDKNLDLSVIRTHALLYVSRTMWPFGHALLITTTNFFNAAIMLPLDKDKHKSTLAKKFLQFHKPNVTSDHVAL